MKKKILFFILFSIFEIMFAENFEIKFMAEDGTCSTLTFDNSAEWIVVDGKKLPVKKIVSIEGFENFSKTENLCFYFLRYSGDYNFLSNLTKLKTLGLMNCQVSSLIFLEKLQNLENAEIQFSADISEYNSIKENKINLSKLQKLKKICIASSRFCNIYKNQAWEITPVCSLDFIPPFINVQNKPELLIYDNRIEKISREELRLLKQYSKVHLDFNPIAKNETELAKLRKAKINFSAAPSF